ncbi:MAG: molecular chaperone TorD family protein [Bdellovibrio sp.]|nr:molecular chaperone TorD family protein [Bdellovibrio sp.]
MKTLATNPASFVLASLLTSYPDQNFENYVGLLLKEEAVNLPESLNSQVEQILQTSDVDDLRSLYIDIFERGQSVNSPYETEYGRHRAMAKGQELGDIAGFYKAFGFELETEGENREILDHVSVELEFYSLLLMKQNYFAENANSEAAEIILDGRKKFLNAHLGRFVSAIGHRPGVVENPYFKEVYGWVSDLVDQECARLGIQPEKTDWIESQKNEETANCGATCK